MRSARKALVIAALGVMVAAGGPAAAEAQEGAGPAPPAGRAEKLRKLFDALGYRLRIQRDIERRAAELAKGDLARVKDIVARTKFKAVEDFFLAELDRRVLDLTLDEIVPVLDTPEGKRMLAFMRLGRDLMTLDLVHSRGEPGRPLERQIADYRAAIDKAIEESAPEATAETNEQAAIKSLRNLASCQAQIQTSGRIDCDADGIGEHATLLELVGAVGVRNGFFEGTPAGGDFSKQGKKVNPPILSPAFSTVDANGVVTKKGYCFRVFLPDSAFPPGFVSEKGPADAVGLTGGTGRVGVEFSETTWCVYAWPEKRGTTGTRAFFNNQMGDVMESANTVAQWSGPSRAPPGNSAFRGKTIDLEVADGVKGSDGDIWKLAAE